jgi:hypothetical protein
MDESGFQASILRESEWELHGSRAFGERRRLVRGQTSLIAGKRGKELLAPVLFTGNTNAAWFQCWLQEHLF